MRVAYFINQYPQVSHTFIRREIIALEAKGVEVERIAIRGWNDEPVDPVDKQEKRKTVYLMQSGIAGLLLPALHCILLQPLNFLVALNAALKMRHMSPRNVVYHIAYLFEACKLKYLCQKNNSTHVHAHFGTNSAEIAMLCYLLGGPTYSFTVHGSEEFDNPLGLHIKEKVAHAKFVVAISSFCRAQLYCWCPYHEWQKIKLVRCGLDDSFYSTTPPSHRNKHPKQLLCIGRLKEDKGQLLLIQAMKLAVDAGVDANLVLAGDGELRSKLEEMIKQFNLTERVSITGWISSAEVKSLLAESDAMILPSFSEGLPVALMEALATRTPVITSYLAGIPELIKHRETGWLCHAGDAQAVAELISDFISTEPEEIERITAQGLKAVQSAHDIDKETNKLIGFIFDKHTEVTEQVEATS